MVRRSLAPVALVLVAALLVSVPAGPVEGLPAPRACGVDRPSSTRLVTVRVNGRARQYYLSVPRNYTGRRRKPLVVDLHGQGSNAQEQILLTRMRQRAGARGWIVATPEAVGRSWRFPPGSGEPPHSRVDEAFIRAIVADVGRRLCLDRRRVFASGMSQGAGLAAALSCQDDQLFAAIGTVAGVNIVPACPGRPPTALVALHGTADRNVPYTGLWYDSVGSTLRTWGRRNGCTSGPHRTTLDRRVTRIAYRGCQARVVLYEVRGGGHTWPGGPRLPRAIFGLTNRTPNGTERILDVFAAAKVS